MTTTDRPAEERTEPVPGQRFRLPADEKERREADFFMDVPRAGRGERRSQR